MMTIYRRRLLPASLTVDRSGRLGAWGLPNGNNFISQGSCWGWMSEKECAASGINLKTTAENAAYYSALPPAKPTKFNPRTMDATVSKEVIERLERCGIAVSSFDEEKLDELAKEVLLGRCDLVEQENQHGGPPRLLRVVTLTVLRLLCPNGNMLVEVDEKRLGEVKTLNRLPAARQQPHESPFVCIRRRLATEFGLRDDDIVFDRQSGGSIVDESESLHFPGVNTLYKRNVVVARLNDKTLLKSASGDPVLPSF